METLGKTMKNKTMAGKMEQRAKKQKEKLKTSMKPNTKQILVAFKGFLPSISNAGQQSQSFF